MCFELTAEVQPLVISPSGETKPILLYEFSLREKAKAHWHSIFT